MASDDIKIKISAEDTGLTAVLNKATAAVTSSAEQMRTRLDAINGVVSKVQSAFVAFAAVLGGGKLFGDAVAHSVQLTKEAAELGRQLGISATDAGTLAVALNNAFISQDQFSTGAAKISQTLKTNEEAFKRLGVATRDQNGHFRNQLDIMLDVNQKLLQFREGADRNIEGVKIYGKAWAQVEPSIRLTREAMTEAAVKAASLGTTIGQENVEATNRYRSAMNDVGDVMDGFQRALADALMPVLSSLGEWFAEHGPQALNIFRAALYAIESVFIQFKGIIVNWTDSIAGSIDIATAYIGRFASWAGHVLKLDFDGADAAWAAGTKRLEDRIAFVKGVVADDARAMQEALQKALDTNSGQQSSVKPRAGGNDRSTGGDEQLKNQMALLEQRLATEKLAYLQSAQAQGSYQEYSKAQELAYWEQVLSTEKLSTENQIAIRRKALQLKLDIGKQEFDGETARLKEQQEAVKSSFDAQIALAQQMVDRMAIAYGRDSQQYADAAKQVIQIERAKLASIEQIRQTAANAEQNRLLGEVAAREQQAQFEVSMGDKTETQLLEQERQFEDERFAIKRDALVREIAAAGSTGNIERAAELNAQLEDLEQQHVLRMDQIDKQQKALQRIEWQRTYESIKSGWQQTMMAFARGALTLKGLFQGLFNSIADALASMVARNISNLLLQALTGKATALKELQANAVAAAGAAYKAVVGIPYVGPFLAPAAAAVAYGGVMAFGSNLPSAAAGYDIPAGVNPVTQLHAREMVLPARHADVIRNLSDSNVPGAGLAPVHLHFNVKAMDAKSVKEMLKNSRGEIARAMRTHLRETGRLVVTQ